jgi:N-methylhydantoinase A
MTLTLHETAMEIRFCDLCHESIPDADFETGRARLPADIPFEPDWVMQALGMTRVLVPPFPGLVSAWGLLVADLVVDAAQTDVLTAPASDAVEERLATLEARIRERIGEQGLPGDGWSFEASIDMRYKGQAYELAVPVERQVDDAVTLARRFHELHAERYGNARPSDAVQAVTYRMRAARPSVPLSPPAPPDGGLPAPEQADAVVDGETRNISFWERGILPAGFAGAGPCVIEEPTATTFVPAGWRFVVDERGCLDLRRG